jgi:acetyl/propionyl-CoA carboxylase alpha subunit
MKLLVANRSEIACRIFQACRERGIGTVALRAPGDEEARHLTYGDEIQDIPSYLDIPAIVAAARASGAKLVHPGYGFLSERPKFAEAVEGAGLLFVGPRAETMVQMGEKIASKELAERIGVPTLPWAKVKDTAELKKEAARIGFPLLLKASAGGGGKGMRKVTQASELETAAESASAEAKAAFGDGTLFVERLVERPRHIEVQVFGDGKGGGVHLSERECSLQRRHQKVWEEAPAPRLDATTRKGLHEAALKLVAETKYRSAGTCEFLVDAGGAFYFLEMNTRLQVEHPVTELVTGVDLVHAQIDQALEPGKAALTSVPEPRGHAIEVRLYAEDPAQGFMPTPGKIESVRFPSGPGIRVDSGIESGQTITTLFDSMLAKLIVHAPTRELAIARMRYVLDETAILGMGTNQAYLQRIARSPAVAQAQVHTHWLETEFGAFDGTVDSSAVQADLELLQALGGAASAQSMGATFASPWSAR